RSYHISSRKIAERLGWKPKRTIEDAIRDLCRAFKAGKFPDSLTNDNYVNVRTVKNSDSNNAAVPPPRPPLHDPRSQNPEPRSRGRDPRRRAAGRTQNRPLP